MGIFLEMRAYSPAFAGLSNGEIEREDGQARTARPTGLGLLDAGLIPTGMTKIISQALLVQNFAPNGTGSAPCRATDQPSNDSAGPDTIGRRDGTNRHADLRPR